MAPKISIIIPVFNREKLIKETLDTIINQSYTDWECILVDDGSTDNGLEVMQTIASSDPRIKLFSRPQTFKKGAPTCRNYGVSIAEGEYIQFFDSDDLMLEEMLQRKIKVLDDNKDIPFVVAKMGEFNVEGTIQTPYYSLKMPENNLWNFMRYRIFFLTPGPLFRKSFLDDFKLKFDSSLDRRQEREFYTRIMIRRPEYLVIDEVLSLRRIHNSSIKMQHEELSDLEQSKSSFLFYSKLSKNAGPGYAGLIYNAYWELIVHLTVAFVRQKSVKYAFRSASLLSSLFLKKALFKQFK